MMVLQKEQQFLALVATNLPSQSDHHQLFNGYLAR